MAKTTAFAGALLDHILNGAAVPGLGGTLYLSLHTADPGVGGTQETSEAAYPGYARAAVARDEGSWTITGNEASPAAAIAFEQATGAGDDVTHFAIGTAQTGPGLVLYFAPLVSGNGDPLPKPITEGDTVSIATDSVLSEA